jgi:hypothetical protein
LIGHYFSLIIIIEIILTTQFTFNFLQKSFQFAEDLIQNPKEELSSFCHENTISNNFCQLNLAWNHENRRQPTCSIPENKRKFVERLWYIHLVCTNFGFTYLKKDLVLRI